MKKIRRWMITLLVCYFAVVVMNRYVIIKVVVDGDSMNPTLVSGDAGMSDRFTYHLFGIGRFDIVMFETESLEDSSIQEVWIKRVIGLPGESLFYAEDGLHINNQLVDEPFLTGNPYHETCENPGPKPAICVTGVTLQENEYFLMGDNRDNSYDSRWLSHPIYRDQIIGRGLILYGFCVISDETCTISRYYFPRFLGW